MPTKTYNRLVDEHLHSLIAQGNHQAFLQLKKRYQKNIYSLTFDLLGKFQNTGIQPKEIFALCEDYFDYAVRKYDPQLSSFYYFWKEITTNYALDYIKDNSYRGDALMFNGLFSLDDAFDDGHLFSDVIAESDEETFKRKLIYEVGDIIRRFSFMFTKEEIVLMSLALDGYTLVEMEKGNMMSRSEVYLTFKNALRKVKNLMKNLGINMR